LVGRQLHCRFVGQIREHCFRWSRLQVTLRFFAAILRRVRYDLRKQIGQSTSGQQKITAAMDLFICSARLRQRDALK
jgi:hypothetical protein